MPETIWVKSGLGVVNVRVGNGEGAIVREEDVSERVALFEVDDLHPGGEAFVAGSDSPPVEVGRTGKVLRYLHDGRLKEAAPGDLERWREERAERRQQALLADAAMFPGAQRGDLSNRIAALEAQISQLQSQSERGRSAAKPSPASS